MMLKFLPVAAIALGLSGGVAFADHGHRAVVVEHRAPARVVVEHRSAPVVVHDRGYRGRVVVHEGPRYYHGGPRYVGYRRPIYVGRPVIHARYYNYYRRPAIVVEDYGPRVGYFWVGGSWGWNGGEWIWAPGHYEPDPAYY